MNPKRVPLVVTNTWTRSSSIANITMNFVRPVVRCMGTLATRNPMKTMTNKIVLSRQLGYTMIPTIKTIKVNNFSAGLSLCNGVSFLTNPNRDVN
jgi:hypothetical protein